MSTSEAGRVLPRQSLCRSLVLLLQSLCLLVGCAEEKTFVLVELTADRPLSAIAQIQVQTRQGQQFNQLRFSVPSSPAPPVLASCAPDRSLTNLPGSTSDKYKFFFGITW